MRNISNKLKQMYRSYTQQSGYYANCDSTDRTDGMILWSESDCKENSKFILKYGLIS